MFIHREEVRSWGLKEPRRRRWAIKNSIYSKAAKYIYIIFIHIIYKFIKGLQRCHGCVKLFLFAPAVLRLIINIHVATTVKRCWKAHYYYLQKEKHQRRFYLIPSIKDNFQTFVCAPRRKEGFLTGNKSTKIKTKRIQKRIWGDSAKSSRADKFLRPFFWFSSKWWRRENNIILYGFYYKNKQDYKKQNNSRYVNKDYERRFSTESSTIFTLFKSLRP